MRAGTRSLLIAAAAAALAIAGCGGDTEEKNDYVDELNSVASELRGGLAEVSAEDQSATSPEKAARSLKGYAATAGDAATELEGISPPEEVTDLHAKLVSDLETLEGEATDAANEIEAGGAASVVGVRVQFLGEANRINGDYDSTISEINNMLQE